MKNIENNNATILAELSKGFNTIMKETLSKPNEDTKLKFFTCKIVNNLDPDREGKCRVRIYGIHSDEISDLDLPWALPDQQFVGSLKGSFIVPPVGAIVKVYFDNNDIYAPVYTTKVLDKSTFSTFKAGKNEDYPDTMIFFETDKGEYFKINRKTNQSTYRHASGVMITIDAVGNLTINGSADGNIEIKSGGVLSLIGESVKIKSIGTYLGEGDVDIISPKAVNILGKNVSIIADPTHVETSTTDPIGDKQNIAIPGVGNVQIPIIPSIIPIAIRPSLLTPPSGNTFIDTLKANTLLNVNAKIALNETVTKIGQIEILSGPGSSTSVSRTATSTLGSFPGGVPASPIAQNSIIMKSLGNMDIQSILATSIISNSVTNIDGFQILLGGLASLPTPTPTPNLTSLLTGLVGTSGKATTAVFAKPLALSPATVIK